MEAGSANNKSTHLSVPVMGRHDGEHSHLSPCVILASPYLLYTLVMRQAGRYYSPHFADENIINQAR